MARATSRDTGYNSATASSESGGTATATSECGGISCVGHQRVRQDIIHPRRLPARAADVKAEGRPGCTRRVLNEVGPHTSDWRVPVGVSFGTVVPGHEGYRQQRLQVSVEDRPGELGYDPCTRP